MSLCALLCSCDCWFQLHAGCCIIAKCLINDDDDDDDLVVMQVTDVVITAGLTCSQLRCGDGERCLLNTASQTPVCFPCDRPCVSTSRRAVCGNDGRTYASRCDLERAACRRGVVLDASHAGRCVAGQWHLTSHETDRLRATA